MVRIDLITGGADMSGEQSYVIGPAPLDRLGKLGVHSQLQALIFALRYQLVELRSTAC